MNKTLSFTLLFCLITTAGFSQNREYTLIDSLRQKKTMSAYDEIKYSVFKVSEVTLSCKKYENIEMMSPDYKQALFVIDSLTKDSLGLVKEQIVFKKNENNLIKAKNNMQKYIDDKDMPVMIKLSNLKKAQKYLDETVYKYDFYRDKKSLYKNCGGKSDFKIKGYVRQNIWEIDKILRAGNNIPNYVHTVSSKNTRNRKELKHISKTNLVLTNTGFYDRTILLIDSIDMGLEIEGDFVKNEEYSFGKGWPKKYLIMSKDYLQFKKNEIVINDTIQNYLGSENIRNICNSNGYVINSTNTNQLYFVNFDLLNEWCYESALAELYSIFKELNITMEDVDNETILTHNGYHCIWTPDLNERLFKKDPTVIKDMNISVDMYTKLLNNDALKLADKLMKHIKSYKALLLTYDRLEEWEKDTKSCDAVLEKMRNLPFASSQSYGRQIESKDLRLHSAIIDYVLYSKNKLGI